MFAKTARKALVAFAVAAGVSASGIAPAQAAAPVPTPVGYMTPCQDVVVLGAQGSGQTFADDKGFGPQAWLGLTAYAQQMDGYSIGYFTVPYPSAPVDAVALATASYRDVFFKSIDQGVYETLNFLQRRVAHCQNQGREEHYVLMGYSQGAMVMHRALWQLTESDTKYPNLGAQVLPLLDGVLAIADGDRVANQGGANLDTAGDNGFGVWWSGASHIAKAEYKPLYKPIPDLGEKWSPAKFQSVCHSKDIVCDTSNLGLKASPNKMLNALLQARNAAIVSDSTKIHTTYYGPDGESSVYVRSAAANIARTSKAANPKVVTPPPLESAKFSMGHEYALTIGEGGTVWASGRNYRGQLGNGTTIDSATPVQVVGLDDVKGVWATYTTSFAVKNDGTVWAWGENGGNVILNGPQYYSASPVQLPGLDGVDSLIVSGDTKYAKKKDGSLWAWHGAPYGHFGGPAMTEPTQMGAVTNVTKVSSHRGWTLALTADGSVWNWGTSYYGMGPRPGQYIGAATPTKVAGISGARDIFTDGNTSYVVNGDGTLWSWGMGGFGLLGTGSYESAMAPVHVAGLTDMRSVSSGPTAVKSDGTVWTWGSNGAGSLGNGTFTDSLVPVQALTSKPISKVFGYGSRFAIAIDGTLWAWGANSRGELGVETTEPAVNRPTEVPIPAAVTALTGGGESTLALTSDDGIWGWGANYFGQLGNGTTADVSGLTRRE